MDFTRQNGSFSTSGESDEGEARITPLPSLLLVAVLRPFKSWRILTLALLAGIGLGAYLISQKKDIFRVEASLLFVPMAGSEASRNAGLPALTTLMQLVDSPANLEELSKEHLTDQPAAALAAAVKVEPSKKSPDMFGVTIEWHDSGQGLAMLRRLLELYVRQITELRVNRLKALAAGLDAEINVIAQREAESRLKESQIVASAGGADLKSEFERTTKDAILVESNLDGARRNLKIATAQLSFVKRALVGLSSKGSTVAVDPEAQFRAQQEKDGRARKLSKLKAQLEEKAATLVGQRNLEKKNIVTPQAVRAAEKEVEDIRGDIAALESEEQFEKEFSSGGGPAGAAARGTGTRSVKDSLVDKESELEQQLVRLQVEIKELEDSLKLRLNREKELARYRDEVEDSVKARGELELSRKKLEEQRDGYLQLCRTAGSEFVVINPPTARTVNQTANQAKKFGIAVGSVFGPVYLFLFVGGFLKLQADVERMLNRIGLAILARIARTRKGGTNLDSTQSQLRRLALHLRQQVHQEGGVMLLSATHDSAAAVRLALGLCRTYALRDERVLVLDARLSESQRGSTPRPETPKSTDPAGLLPNHSGFVGNVALTTEAEVSSGLVSYLTGQSQDLSSVVRRLESVGIDVVPAGGPCHSTDVLATTRMSDLMREASAKYSLVLLIGPSIEEAVDLEILAAYAAGVVLVVDGPRPNLVGTESLVRSWREVRVPVLGAVVED